jgi:hypothetical protein
MSKPKNTVPYWVRNLRTMMEQKHFNPRSLSLKSGLNATAVRDMLEGRTKFPRYDTAMALAATLGTTPARLMAQKGVGKEEVFGEDLELLAEILTLLLEAVEENNETPKPRAFAAMAATIYRNIQESESGNKSRAAINAEIHKLLDYEGLKKKARR